MSRSAARPAIRMRFLLYAALGLAVVGIAVGALWVTQSPEGLPSPSSDEYRETVSAFYRGLAAVEVGLLDDARTQFAQAAVLAPAEPAIAANLAVAHIGFGDDDAAAAQLDIAQALAPDSSEIAFLQGQLAGFRGQFDDAATHYRRAAELSTDNLKARFALAQELEQSGDDNDAAEAQRLLEEILERQPGNLAVLVAHVRLAAGRSDTVAVTDGIAQLVALSAGWPATVQEQLDALATAVAERDMQRAGTAAALLRNVLVRVTAFLESQAAVSVSVELVAEPLRSFLRLPSPPSTAAPIDDTLSFTVESLDQSGAPTRSVAGIVLSNDTVTPAIVAVDDRELRLIDTGASFQIPEGTGDGDTQTVLRAFDWNSDFRNDIVVTHSGSLVLLEQTDAGTFQPVSLVSRDGDPLVVPEARGVWVADLEMDGDLDVLLGSLTGAPEALQNNGDGTWTPMQPFPDLRGVVEFVWGDLDRDGDPDAAFLDTEGRVSLFANRQAGQFTAWAPTGLPDQVVAVVIGDLDADSRLDLVTLDETGELSRSTWVDEGWQTDRVAVWDSFQTGGGPAPRLLLADLDNNGALDLTASGAVGTRIWLSDERSVLEAFPTPPSVHALSVIDLNGDGWLDFVGLQGGVAVRVLGRGTAGYQWQEIRPRAQLAAGDQRINSFGVGGEIEVRSGLLVQKQVLTGAPLHFGLGVYPSVDVTRIVWPNGVMQADFDFETGQVVIADQRLKGSCPWVFTYDGAEMRFVTDFLWRSPLGLKINAQQTAGIPQTEDWVLVRGDQLVPRDGEYDLRITAELWETHFFDATSLMVVDHPEATEIHVDERFTGQPIGLAAYTTGVSQSVQTAWDDTGADVTDLVDTRDGRYVASVERGRYQGVTRDHLVEFELGPAAADHDAIYVLAHGWVYPTDSSINVAIGQGDHPAPRGVALEAQDRSGGWQVVHPDLGFPAGKNKTMVIELLRQADGHLPRRLRLRTNLEVYWDWIGYAPQLSEASVESLRLEPHSAKLRYRGFSRTDFLGPRRLEIPRYAVANTRPRWRDLVGYHTRFGDVRELLAEVDDRYVIMNAGDELTLRFPVPEPPPIGWRRDFVLIGDGWVKDGDFNTMHSKTVGPLPSHDDSEYRGSASPALDDDPVYRRFSKDWQTYHTRFVSPTGFLTGLR